MKMLAVDDRNDIYIGLDGKLTINKDLEACMQACEHAAQAQLGEMILSLDQGIPNFQTIWRDSRNVAQFEAYLRRALLSVENVIEVKDLETIVRDNKLFYTATIATTFGLEVTNGQL